MLQPDKLKKLNENAAKMAAEGSSEQEILAMRDAFIKQFGTKKTALVKKKVASDSSLEDGSSESQKISSRRKDMPKLTEEGFAEGMKKASRSPEELQKKQEASSFKKELQKGKEKGAVLKNANESALNTESPFEQSYKQDTVNTYEALGVPKKEEPTQLESFLGVPEEVQKNKTEALNTFKPSKEKIVEEYNKLDLDNPKPYISSSTYNRQPENGIQINKDSFVDDIFGDDKLLKSGIDPADFDGFLNLSGFKDQYIDRKKRGDFDPSIKSDHDAKLADDLYKNKMLSAYVNTLNDRAVLKSKLTSVIGSYDGKKIPVNKQARVLDNSVISEYIDENLPSLSKKLKEKDELNKEKYKELTNDNTGLNSFWVGSKNTLKGGYNSFVDAVNKSTSTILDLVGAEDLADDARYLNEERQLERPTERQVAFAFGKVVNLNGKKYLVDEKGTIYDKDNEIVVNDLLDENTYKNILNKSNESKEEDWFISPQGAAVQTGNVLGDMIWQIAYQGVAGNVTKGIGAASYLNKIKIPKPTADAIIAQSSLGYSQAYEQTLKEAKDAGLTDKESEEIASDAAQRTALWYAVTAPISPQTKATEALFGSAEKSMIKNAISAYKEKGKQGFISSITKGLKEIPKKAAEFSEEGLKETVQENIQQAGESYIINAQKNIDAGKEISNETMSFDDFINTSILSFLSAGTVASLNVPNFSSNKKMQIRNLYELSQNMDVLDSNLKQMVENKIITKEDAEKVRTDAIAVSRNITKIPKNTNPDVQLDLVRKLNDIDNLENKKNELDKSFHPDVDKQIDKIRGEISSVYNESLTKKEETNAVQEQSTTEIPVQSEARISEQVAERVSEPKPEITTEQGTQEEVAEPETKVAQEETIVEPVEAQAEATQPQTIIEEQVAEDVVKVKKSPDFMNDAEHIVTLNGEEAGRMYYDRSSKTWRDPNFDRSKHSPESFERIYGDILGDTKQEATDELIRRRKESMKQETPVEESVTEEVVSKEPQGVQFSKDTILNKFLNKLNSLNPIQKNPIDNKSFIYGNKASLEFNRFDKGDKNEISLEGITSLDKGKGLGKEAMVDITKSADELGTTLTLDAKPFGREGLGKKELINFYKKNGFEVDQQYLEDLDFASEQEAIDYVLENESEALPMIRKPQPQAVSEQSVEEVAITEITPAEADKIKSDIEASKERLKKAWDKYKTIGIAFDPKNNLARDRELVKALVEYAYNNIRLGSYTASKLIEDLASQGFEMTRDGANFIMDRASRKVQRNINKTISVKPKSTEQKRINKAYSIGVATQKVATKEVKSEVKDLKGQVVDAFRAGIEAIKVAETTAKEKARDIKNKAQDLAKYLDELKGVGKITADQATAMVKRFSKVNVLSEKSVNRFIDYTTKVLNDADYVSKLAEARKTLSSIKSLSKNEDKNINLRTVGKEFSKIEPSMVEDIEEYNNIASKLKTAIDGSKARGKDVKIADTINIDEVSSYIEKTITEQEEKLRQEKIDEIQNLFGVDASKFSAEEIDAMLEEDSDKANDNKKIIRAAAKKAFDIYSTVIKEMIKTGVDPFTDEEVSFTEEEKGLIEKFMDIDIDTVADPKEVLRMVDSLINFIQNKSTAGMLKPIADYSSVLGGNEIVKQKLIAKKLRKYWIPSLGLSLSKQFTTTPVLFDKLFKGINRALIVEDLSGISDLIRNVSLTQTQANKIAKKYVKEFYKKQANGDAFNTLFNDIERGVFAHVLRTSLGDESKSKSIFEKRKKEVLEVVKILREKGDDSESQIAEVLEKVYNKILDGSESIEDVKKKVDETNAEAVDFWIKEWSNIYDPLRDLAVNFYNKSLERDFNFTPDRFRKLKDKMGNEDLEDIQSQFLANTDEILYDKKSGSLIDKQENRKIPKDMYIDFSFDKKNANAMYDALMDLNTAYDLRKVGSFLKSDNFRKIFPSRNEARLVDRRIKKYVRISRKKMPYSGDDIESSLKALDKLTKIGVSMSLASVKQPFVQTIPIMFSTAVNAGGTGLSAVVDKDYNKWLDDLGYAISNRGSEAQLEVESLNKLIEKAAESKSEKAFKYIEELNDKALKIMLSNPDIWIARASFKAYYEQYLKKHGEESNIDYSSHKVNKDAANYAQRMIDRQQGISDHALAGDIFTSDNKITQTFVKMIMPFSSFRMNQSSRLSSDLSTLEYWNTSTKEDKIIAMRSIAGYTLEAVAYRSLQVSFGVLMNIIANKIMDDDDDEDDKKYLETSLKGAVQGFGVDTFSSIPTLDFAIQDLLALGAEGVQELMEVPEEKKIELFYSEKQSALKYFGTYGIPIERAKEIFELGKLAYTREYEDKYGNKKKITEKNADRLKPLVGVAFASSVFRLANPDITSVIRKSIKLAKKNNSLYMENLKEKNPEKYKRIKEKIKSFKEKALKRKER